MAKDAKARREAGQAQSKSNKDDTKDSTPWAVVIARKRGRAPLTWRRYVSEANALAELRLLHERGIVGAQIQGPR